MLYKSKTLAKGWVVSWNKWKPLHWKYSESKEACAIGFVKPIEYVAPSRMSIMPYILFPTTYLYRLPTFTPTTLAKTHNDFLLPNTANKCSKVNKTNTWLKPRSSISSTDSLYAFIKLITINVIFLTWEMKGSQRSVIFYYLTMSWKPDLFPFWAQPYV